jgi:hypothetical protein
MNIFRRVAHSGKRLQITKMWHCLAGMDVQVVALLRGRPLSMLTSCTVLLQRDLGRPTVCGRQA